LLERKASSDFLADEARTKKETGRKLKIFRSDGGGKYLSKEVENYPKDEGIAHETTPRSTSEMNGVAERMNQTAIEEGRGLLDDADDDNPSFARTIFQDDRGKKVLVET